MFLLFQWNIRPHKRLFKTLVTHQLISHSLTQSTHFLLMGYAVLRASHVLHAAYVVLSSHHKSAVCRVTVRGARSAVIDSSAHSS